MDFELRPGGQNFRTNRNLALISLHSDFTNALGEIDKRARPIELPLMDYYVWRGGLFGNGDVKGRAYQLTENWQDQVVDFSKGFERKYPEVEQVYVFSRYNRGNSFRKINQDNQTIYENNLPASNALGKALNDVFIKRFLILEYFGPAGGYHYCQDNPSSDEEIKRTIERSLEFNSW